jgi:hypothetical protein
LGVFNRSEIGHWTENYTVGTEKAAFGVTFALLRVTIEFPNQRNVIAQMHFPI